MKQSAIACLFTVWILSVALKAEDEDKARLFNTFYLEGPQTSYVLIMRSDRTFDLYGPNNDHVAGRIKADDKHVTLLAGDEKRIFRYENKGADLHLERRESDIPVKGSLLGELPPISKSQAVYLAQQTWHRKGRPLFVAPVVSAGPAVPVAPRGVAAPLPVPSQPPPPAQPPSPDGIARPVSPGAPAAPAAPGEDFSDLAGNYSLGQDALKIDRDGRFDFARADGAVQTGSLMRADGELIFISAKYKRNFNARMVPGGLELVRRETDVIKSDDVLGAMPPQVRDPLVWKSANASQPQAASAPVTTAGTVAAPIARGTALEPAGTPVKDAKELAGTFVHRPNAFVSETLVFVEDGTFSYKDSTGASASGTYKVENGGVVLIAGDVERHLSATVGGGSVTLTRTDADTPKLKNDLATMSPTVLKSARYESKK